MSYHQRLKSYLKLIYYQFLGLWVSQWVSLSINYWHYWYFMEGSLILLQFLVFSYIIDDHSCLKCYIFTKVSQIMCLIDVHILVCQHAKCDCRFALFENFWLLFSSPMFLLFFQLPVKRSQTQNGLYKSMFQTILRNVCLLVTSEFYLLSVVGLSSVARLQPTPAYVEV